MKKYNIVLARDSTFILAQSCSTLKLAKQYLKDMKKVDKQLKKYYNWKTIPKYKIVESEGK